MTTTTSQILDLARRLDYPQIIVSGGCVATAGAYSREAQFPGNHASMLVQLEAHQANAARSDEQRKRWDEEDRRRAEVGKVDAKLIEEDRREAEESYREYERRRPERTEALLRDIRDTLQAIAKRA